MFVLTLLPLLYFISWFFFFNFSPDEISEVKKKSIKFAQESLKTKGTSFNYILVPFSDPGLLLFDQLHYPTK